MTTNVFWPQEEATDLDGNKQQVTIFAWDYEAKRGTAYLPGLHFVTVRQERTGLTIEPEEKKA